MRKITYFYTVSLDGFIEGPDADLSWTVPDEELHTFFNRLEDTVDTHLYGRRMYELMAAFWPTADDDPDSTPAMKEYAGIWRSKAKIVYSRTLESVGPNAKLMREAVPDEIRAMKQQPGMDMSVSGANLATTFMKHDLIDEYQLTLRPLLLGGGKRMFGPLEQRLDLRLIEDRGFDSGVRLLRYERVRDGV